MNKTELVDAMAMNAGISKVMAKKALDGFIKSVSSALKKGDKVVTVGGIHGVISSTKEKTVIVKVDDNAKIEFSRNAIATVVVEKAEKDSKAAKDDKKADKTEEAPAAATEASTEENK